MLLAPLACDSSAPEAVARLADGGNIDAISPADLFIRDECARATATHCATPFAYCSADATCGRALTCLANCTSLPCNCDKDVDRSSTVSVARYASALECLTDARNTLAECPESDAYTNPLLKQVCPPGAPQEDACTQCLEDVCCDARHALKASPEGEAVRECELGCGSISTPEADACRVECYRASPEASLIWRTIVACGTVRCGAQCGSPPNACAECQKQRCGDSFAAVLVAIDGLATSNCVGRCNESPSCISACLAQASPEARNAVGALLLCANRRCASACGN